MMRREIQYRQKKQPATCNDWVLMHLFVSLDQPVDYPAYQLFHFFNITRPADMLYHIGRIKVPFVVSPILVDYSEYDKQHRTGGRIPVSIIFRWE